MTLALLRHKAAALCAAASMALLLSACGGGGGGGDDGPRAEPPTAQITSDLQPGADGRLTLEVGKSVTLKATASSPRAGADLRYTWTLAQKPSGSKTAMAGADQSSASFIPDLTGSYQISLVVNDGTASSNAVQVVIEAVSLDPIAVAGEDFVTLVGQPVQLDGGRSTPPTGGDPAKLQYQWSLASVPEGSAAVLDDPANAYPRFTPDKEGVYRASLKVSYEDRASKASAEASVNAQKANVPADIKVKVNGQEGSSFTAQLGRPVVLDASDTVDPDTPDDKSKLQFRWRYANSNLPPNGQPELANATSSRLTWTPGRVNGYVGFELQVFDGASINTRSITLKVEKPAGEAPLAPVVNTPIQPFGNQTYEVEAGKAFRLAGYEAAYNPDNSSDSSMLFKWTWIAYPSGWDPANPAHFDRTPDNWGRPDETARSATFTPLPILQAGVTQQYTVDLQACRQDNPTLCGNTVRQTYTARLGANRAPAAAPKVSTANTTVGIGTRVTLDGSDSSDPDTNALTYAWTLLDKPDGSNATLTGASGIRPTFTPDKAGPYRIALVVTDSHGFASQPAVVNVRAKNQNHKPSVRLTLDRPYSRQQPLLVEKMGDVELNNTLLSWTGTIDAWNGFGINSNAIDVDGDPLTYLWSIRNEPSGNVAKVRPDVWSLCQNGDSYTDAKGAADGLTPLAYLEDKLKLRSWTCANVAMAPSVPGDYTFSASVYDGSERIGPFVVTIPAADRANYPGLLLESNNTGTQWSNDEQRFVLKTDTAHPAQVLFPYVIDARKTIMNSGSSLDSSNFRGDFVTRTYRLMAGDRDYTIVNLKATDTGGVYQPRFSKLENGQVIRKGETVEFQLVLPITAALEKDADGKVVNRDTFEWSFETAENAAFSFSFKPKLYSY